MEMRSYSSVTAGECLAQPNVKAISDDDIISMKNAGKQIKEAYRLLDKAGINIVSEVLKGQGTFYEMEHYPQDDVYDSDSHSQYYYHNHRGLDNEHGHFHTFLRAKAIPEHIKPSDDFKRSESWPLEEDAITHFISISMNAEGFPIGLFATNRWVTDQTWYSAENTIALLDRFEIDHAHPNLVVNQWLTAMLKLFKFHIAELLIHRDHVIADWAMNKPTIDALEDRKLEVTGYYPISVDEWIKQLE